MLDDRYANLEPDVLHLFFENGEKITFSPEQILDRAKSAWQSPELFPDEIKGAVEMEACDVCPLKGSVDLCHAIFPILHFLDAFEQHPSYERVTIAMINGETKAVQIQETSVQEALQPISILSLTSYCEVGHKYHELFYGVDPFLSPDEFVIRLAMNAFWLAQGNRELATERLKKLFEELEVTIHCQLKRISLITKGDAFLNAFVRMNILTKRLYARGFALVDKAFEAHRASLPQELIPQSLTSANANQDTVHERALSFQ